MENQFLLATDASKILDCSSNNVRQLEKSGKLKAVRTASGVRIFDSAEVHRLAAERKRRDRK
jgi:DNA-binding transcriptional MerR regulator